MKKILILLLVALFMAPAAVSAMATGPGNGGSQQIEPVRANLIMASDADDDMDEVEDTMDDSEDDLVPLPLLRSTDPVRAQVRDQRLNPEVEVSDEELGRRAEAQERQAEMRERTMINNQGTTTPLGLEARMLNDGEGNDDMPRTIRNQGDREEEIPVVKSKLKKPNPRLMESSERMQSRDLKASNAQGVLMGVAERLAEKNNIRAQEAIEANIQRQAVNREGAEEALLEMKAKSKIARFLFGHKDEIIEEAKTNLEAYKLQLDELRATRDELDINDPEFDASIEELRTVREELQAQIEEERQAFSLFGWTRNLFSRNK